MGNGTTPASGKSCPPDLAIKNCRSALLYPNKAPLAKLALSLGLWDLRATWAHVPDQKTVALLRTVLVYFHGHHNGVKVDQDGKCVQPDWATAAIFSQFTDCTPHRYDLDVMADAAATSPIVLSPENTDPANRIKNIAGTFADGEKEFGLFIGECMTRLSLLQKHATCTPGGTYIPPNRISAIRRLITVAHSGGGITLIPCASSKIMDFLPSDLVQLDCLYGHDGGGEAFCTKQKAKGNLGMGNGKDQSRIVITTTGGSTEISGDALVQRLKQVLGLPLTKVTYDVGTKRPSQVPDFTKVGGGIMEIVHFKDATRPSAANVDFISQAMKNCPVVYIHTDVAHDLNPNVFIPLVVNSVGT